MRFLIVLILLSGMMLSCKPRKESSEQTDASVSHTLDELQGEWQMLTEWGYNQWVIYRPCDADNRMIHVRSDTLVIGWGQDASIGLIKSFYRDDEGRTLLDVADLDMNERATYAFHFEDERKLSRWWLVEGESADLFAHEDILDNYTVYEQPCSECWDDCEDGQ